MHQKLIVTLAAAMMILFVLTSGYEAELFPLRLYQAGIYLVIILLFFYFEDRWAYMFGVLAPIFGILVSFATGSLWAQAGGVYRLLQGNLPANPASLLGALRTVCGVALAILSYRAFRKEIVGTPHARRTIWGSLIAMVIYYGVLIFWFSQAVTG